ncbi:MAG TPA: hypothetical protein VHD36_02435 [Pirellulales bacterium]|nr:hypothetical protein [Pirellulales bacterium]
MPFTPFEYYYLLEDRPEYASTFPVRLQSRGMLDRAAFSQAFTLTVQRHPFLMARIEYDRRDWPRWAAGDPPPIHWAKLPADPHASAFSRAACSGLQMTIGQAGDLIDWEFVFHHVAVDGLGAFQFIMDLFLAYDHLSLGSAGPLPWRKVDAARLRDRDGHQLFKQRLRLKDLFRLLRVTLPLNVQKAAIVSNHDHDPTTGEPSHAPDDLVHHLSEHETSELSRIAAVHSVMLHDLLLRDYFLTLDEWNRGTTEARRPIRILVPTNLRRREDYRMPAANVFSFTFLSRRARDCRDRAALLDSIQDEMAEIKRQKRGLYFEAGLRIFCIWPALLRWSLSRPWPFATAIFSNLGAGLDNVPLPLHNGLRVCGDLAFEGGSGAAPVRPDTRVSLAIHTYAGRMAICVRCDPRSFHRDQRRALLDAYVQQLRTTIETES